MDHLTPERRSENMRRILGKDTQPERVVRRLLTELRCRYRLHRRSLPGNPDIVLPQYRLAIFVHGCFWHGHTCKDGHRPKSNRGYWNQKLARNQQRDRKNYRKLRLLGWKRLIVWSCRLENLPLLKKRLATALLRMKNAAIDSPSPRSSRE